MLHRKRLPAPMTVRLDTAVEREFWRQYFDAGLEDIEAAIAEAGDADIAIAAWLVANRRGRHAPKGVCPRDPPTLR